eukprot:TRINITY_DN34074_c0_g1_i1.p1 TRINITY_DN34074_c0_g1~~TRINITY_DN34074_c0_g1_i1.p1  ORF type:complete len:325 (-),score=57.87 TRINITY_DN34074_c0_g1_i1:181-1155(-)
MAAVPPPQPPEPYISMHKIGEGTYGEVYMARRVANDDIVAIKHIPLESEEEGIPSTAIREISLLRELHHPNIVRLLDVYHTERPRRLSLVFEYCNEDLKHFIDRHRGPLPPRLIQHLAYQLLLGVAHSHARRVLHRDLKPQNLLVALDASAGATLRSVSLKLADFGLARAFGIPVRKLTHEVVTLWYRAPDVLAGSVRYGPEVDMWSVGCVLAELATGRPTFPGHAPEDQLALIIRLLGTPTEHTWPSWQTLPSASIVASAMRAVGVVSPSELREMHSALGDGGVALLRSLFRYDPAQRIAAADALQHPYFADYNPDAEYRPQR